MTRLQSFDFDVKQLIKKANRANMPDVKMLTVEICFDLKNMEFTYSWGKTNCPSGLEKEFLKSMKGYMKCKKTDATILVTIGEQTNEGCFIIGKYKNYWLKSC